MSDSVVLLPPEPEDFVVLARWAATNGGTGARANGGADIPTSGELEQLVRTGAVRFLMVCVGASQRVGAVSWTPSGAAGYSLGVVVGDPGRWNGGAGASAVLLVLDHLFHGRNAHRVEGTVGLHNPDGITLLTRSGFVLEGLLRDYFFLDGAYHDAAVFSLLQQEYYAVVSSGRFGAVPDVVPAAEKARARRRFDAYLARLPGDPVRTLAARDREAPLERDDATA